MSVNRISKVDNLYQIKQKTIDINYFVKLLFAVSLMVIVSINLIYSKNPILDLHGFRQTQTALSAYYLKQDGFKFNYETPVIGEPWSIPFEFPIYQQIVASTSELLTASLTQTGRVWGLIFILLTCLPIYLMLTKLMVDVRAIYFSLALFLSSPVYIFWSGTFMIESAALFFSCSFLYFAINLFQRGWTNRNFIFFSLFLLLALLQKVTTPLPILSLVLIALLLFAIKLEDFSKNFLALVKMATAIIVPVAIAFVWVKYSDQIKMENPIGSRLTSSSLAGWNYGSLHQRLSKEFWLETIYKRNIKTSSFYFFGLSSILAAIFLLKNRFLKVVILMALLAFLLPFLIFTNLHYVHNYYQNSNSIFLSIAVGISVCYLCDRYLKNREFIYGLVLVSFICSNFMFFYKDYYAYKSTKITTENNRTLALSDFIKSHTPKERPIVVYGYDWSSEIAFYSERKSLTVPAWGWDIEAIEKIGKFLKNDSPSAYVLCPVGNIDLIKNAINKKFPTVTAQKVNDCEVYLL